jgi:hypothetical protein
MADSDPDTDADDAVRAWLVERSYGDDELNIIILVYATPDGERYLRKELALRGPWDARDTPAAIDVDPSDLGAVTDPDERERYRTEAERMMGKHDPDDAV